MNSFLPTRRSAVALGASLLAGFGARKSWADEAMAPLAALKPVTPAVAAPAGIAWREVAADGTATLRTVAEEHGHPLLLNVWATWCGPCVLEMPALDALSVSAAAKGIVVRAVSIDYGGAAAVRPFYARAGIRHLPVAIDADARTRTALSVGAVPVSFLIGADGRLRARIDAATDWSRPEVIPRLEALLG